MPRRPNAYGVRVLRRIPTLMLLALAACGPGEALVFGEPDRGVSMADTGRTLDDGVVQTDAADMAMAPDDGPPRPALRDDARPAPNWKAQIERVIDGSSLPAYFASVGYSMPAGAGVYAMRVVDGAEYPAYQVFDAGIGAFDMGFWPASTIKLLAAVGALEWVFEQGFTGAARVDWDSGFGDVLRDIYGRSIRVSSNIDYDRTLRAAGWDYMNATFLTAERGFGRAVITGSYARVEVRNPGGYTLSEAGVSQYIPGRAGLGEYGRNDTDLYELTEGVRRVMLDGELPTTERFRIDAADVAELQDALCAATPSYFASGAATALGGTPRICHKPGWVPDNECLDHGLITTEDGARYLIAATVPYVANCPGLSPLARHTLAFLSTGSTAVPLQPDAGAELPIQIDATTITVGVAAADEVALWIDGVAAGRQDLGDRGQFVIAHDLQGTGERLVSVAGYAAGRPIAFRSGLVSF